MQKFFEKVDKRSREEMEGFLTSHYRYDTMNSWNQSKSFANCIKLRNLPIPKEIDDTAYEMLQIDEPYMVIQDMIEEWTEEHNGSYTVGFNGRSGGYLVLYQSQYEKDPHKSICLSCGQKNYARLPDFPDTPEGRVAKYVAFHNFWIPNVYLGQSEVVKENLPEEKVLEIVKETQKDIKRKGEYNSGQCGRCESTAMEPYNGKQLKVWPGRGMSIEDTDYEIEELKDMTELVQSFDKLCDEIVTFFIEYCKNHKVVEDTIMVERQIKISEPV